MDNLQKEKRKPWRCERCKSKRVLKDPSGFRYFACYQEPYHGTWVANVEKCPKGEKNGSV